MSKKTVVNLAEPKFILDDEGKEIPNPRRVVVRDLTPAEEAQRAADDAEHAADAPDKLRREHHKRRRAAVEAYLEDQGVSLESDLTPAQLAELRAIIRDVPVPRGSARS